MNIGDLSLAISVIIILYIHSSYTVSMNMLISKSMLHRFYDLHFTVSSVQ